MQLQGYFINVISSIIHTSYVFIATFQKLV